MGKALIKALIPRRAKATLRERGQLFVLGLASIFEGLVAVLSLGFYTTDIRSWVLFDYFED